MLDSLPGHADHVTATSLNGPTLMSSLRTQNAAVWRAVRWSFDIICLSDGCCNWINCGWRDVLEL